MCGERGIGRDTCAKKDPCPVPPAAPQQHLPEVPPLGPERLENLELPPLNEVPPSESFAHQTEGLFAHRDAARLDRAILKTGVLMTELAERLTLVDEHSWPAELEMEHHDIPSEPHLAATLTAL